MTDSQRTIFARSTNLANIMAKYAQQEIVYHLTLIKAEMSYGSRGKQLQCQMKRKILRQLGSSATKSNIEEFSEHLWWINYENVKSWALKAPDLNPSRFKLTFFRSNNYAQVSPKLRSRQSDEHGSGLQLIRSQVKIDTRYRTQQMHKRKHLIWLARWGKF